MGWYADQVVPLIVNLACGAKSAPPLRRRVCTSLAGEIVEIGFGTGHNVPFYPPEVTSVDAVEPSDTCWRLAADRIATSPVSIRRSGHDAQKLPYEDASFAAALCTWTQCTVPDAAAALAELRRVLRPGSALHFVEHGLAPNENVRRWQRRLEPLNKRVLGGCHLTRPVVPLLSVAGFTIRNVDVFYEEGAPKPWGADTLGVAFP
ncbi:class I SAM-dependent methyltransferase [Streptomyces sp. NPDC014870]|uniref:class I SAM-dependent methyltransferase n=1 Tax=Streptomyces sp. NPDC014870 TaxID=3364925 RepID=UPI0036FDAAD6